MENRQNGTPLAVYFSSGSRPSLPTRITLLTDLAIEAPQTGFTLAFGRWPRRLKFPELCRCSAGFARIRKLVHNFSQSTDCLRLIVFGEGEAFLQKGSSTCIAIRIFLQDQIELRFRLVIFLKIDQCLTQPDMCLSSMRIVRILHNEVLIVLNRQII